jgi:PAS domain S-box-containing protein
MEETITQWDVIAAGVVAIMTIIGWISSKLKTVQEWLNRKGVVTTRHRINEIYHQLTADNSGSLREAVNKTRYDIERLGAARKADLNSDDCPLVETDVNGQLVWANEAFICLVGRSLHSLRGSGWVNVIAEDERDFAEHQWAHILEAHRTLDAIHTYVTPVGRQFKVRVLATPMLSEENKFFGYQAKIKPLDPSLIRGCREEQTSDA